MAGSPVKWPFSRAAIIPNSRPGSVGFGFKSSDPFVVAAYGVAENSETDPLNPALTYIDILSVPNSLPTTGMFPVANFSEASYLDLFLASIDAAPTGGPSVRAFGGKIIHNNTKGNRWHPVDADSSFEELNSDNQAPSSLSQGIWWKPLYNPKTGDHVQTFNASAPEIVIVNSEASFEYRTGQLTYFVGGSDIILVVPCTDPDNIGSYPHQLVVGQFGA